MNLTISISAGTTKRLLVLSTAASILGLATVAYAALPQFTENETLSEVKLNGSFNALDNRLAAVELEAQATAARLKAVEDGAKGTSGYAEINSMVKAPRGTWVDVPGLVASVTTTQAEKVDIDGFIEVTAEDVAADCVMRFVVDTLVAGGDTAIEGSATVKQKFEVPYVAQIQGMRRVDFSAATHNVKVQVQTSASLFPGGICVVSRGQLRVRSAR